VGINKVAQKVGEEAVEFAHRPKTMTATCSWAKGRSEAYHIVLLGCQLLRTGGCAGFYDGTNKYLAKHSGSKTRHTGALLHVLAYASSPGKVTRILLHLPLVRDMLVFSIPSISCSSGEGARKTHKDTDNFFLSR
jgi:hypothetical protein